MKIRDLSQYGENFIKPLLELYDCAGNSLIDGYLGEELHDVVFDEEGRIHYSTHKEVDETNIDSNGVVMDRSVLIKQTQKGRCLTTHRLYSWDLDEKEYTLLEFDNSISLNQFFNTITRFNTNLCGEDITKSFKEMGLSFESITNIFLNQKTNPMDRIFEEEMSKDNNGFTK